MSAAPRVRKLARTSPARALALLVARLHALERAWEDAPARGRALAEARRLANELAEAGAPLPPGAKELPARLARGIERHELAALAVPLERALERGLRDEDFLPRSDAAAPRTAPMPVAVVADSLRSAFNVGGAFRTAECFGALELVLTGYSATPDDPRVARAAMGAERLVPWRRERSADDAVGALRARGFAIVALETGDAHPALRDAPLPFPCALVLGNERHGLSPALVARADARVRIPTAGAKGSLNVVSALAIALYELRGRWEARGGSDGPQAAASGAAAPGRPRRAGG